MGDCRTSEIAARFGIHPNTVRFYEEAGLLTPPRRKSNGYRVYTELHVREIRLIRLALRSELLLSGLRKRAVSVLRQTAACRFSEAIRETRAYAALLSEELDRARRAAFTVENRLASPISPDASPVTRRDAADALGVTQETVRNWERNGLAVGRMERGRRVYDPETQARLSIIRVLRAAGYSLTAIRQLTALLGRSPAVSVPDALHVSRAEDNILTACDRLIASLDSARADAAEMLSLLESIRADFATLQ